MNDIKIIEVLFDEDQWTFSFVLNTWIIVIIAAGYLLVRWLIKKYRKGHVTEDIIPVKLTYELGGAAIEYQITRNYQHVEIAHKIYIELITRKAAIKIDQQRDVIVEIYNSWYALFQTTREELKKISGELLWKNTSSASLIGLLSDILNKGLRPHLTEYQAKFRKWYQEEIDKTENIGKTPQAIQEEYPDYDQLISSMTEVNQVLIDYAEELKKIINGS
ncbi:hypothetical protein QQ020_35110 [Fulvivirgaceae bacterium BMA12]|uniref:Uncharacterized protein n=1 Tax=Agaribacillus aureus TaxID=3051825 RepID=A0ABT8LHU8_9BACT|nr:hypothetical protein [Fulvivirgaceae bacterium BMA12]